ncbi:aldehyde dehydrogenase family protein [Legionella israelensis]|uniref:aldehyde dehydrogenase family protein n=1 Tax=Legionella israelensis TaxID=454 RepID=UPI00117D6759|nr:aldehyde dehydrogenase family protein [Legionella israelensis]QDP72744.1 aldehyde dehydrogenase family protein [Legionella israelensis]
MSIGSKFDDLKKNQEKIPYPSAQRRIDLLISLRKGLQEQAILFANAISNDFSHRSRDETLAIEVFFTLRTINFCIKNTKKWMKKRKRKISWLFRSAYAYLLPQPLGVVGIMVPWNFPLYLALVPAAYAISAGNRIMIKVSELTPNTGKALIHLIKSAKLEDYIHVVDGDIETAKIFTNLPFGHLLFTGSTQVGKKVMEAASRNLTPVTLELGGKSPAIVSKTVSSAYFNRLFMGKLLNAGQTCVAPDYLFIPEGWEEKIEQTFRVFMNKHYPHLENNSDYTAIISESHKKRLQKLIEDAQQKGARVICFGDHNLKGQKLPVYLVFNVHQDMLIMQQEVFGPILPIMSYQSFNQVIQYINSHPCPLSLYYFGQNKEEKEQLLLKTLSGGFIVNNTIMQTGIDDLPFGGVGASGMGTYHGREGFDVFSKLKSVFVQRRIALLSYLYPPYGKLLTFFLKKIGKINFKSNL